MSRAECIFCGATPTTREHIVPDWAYRALAQDPRGLDSKGEHARYIDDGTEQSWESRRPIDFVANCVCASCNSGWMSEIENSAKPLISQMIMNQEATLDRDGQAAIASWLALKAIVERYSHTPIVPISKDWIESFYLHRIPPITWYARMGRYIGDSWPAFMAGGDFEKGYPHPLAASLVNQSGLAFTVAIGYFAAQIVRFAPSRTSQD